MATEIVESGRDQYDQIKTALTTGDRHCILHGGGFGIMHRDAIEVPEGALLEPYDSDPIHGLQSYNDCGPIYENGALILPNSFIAFDSKVTARDWQGVRTKDHIDITGDGAIVRGIFVHGTKTAPGRTPNLRDPITNENHRNMGEDQVGVNVHGAQDVLVEDVNIENIGGDFAGANPSGSGTSLVNSKNLTIRRGVWKNAGRHGLGANGVNGLLWEGTEVHDHASSMFHIENSANPYGFLSDIIVQDIDHVGGDFTIHCRIRGGIDNFQMLRIYDHSLLRIDINDDQGGPRFTRLLVDGCKWDGASNEVLQIGRTDGLTVRNLEGHLLWNGVLFDAAALSTCTGVVQNNPLVVRDPRP